VYVGIESDADQGLDTLRRWAHAAQNKKAVEIIRGLDLYACFNLLVFDPDTTLDALETNVRFLRWASELPANFGRVELYAGTPLLARMQQEGRVTGDWMAWDYRLASEEVERVFKIAMTAFHARNFGEDALANRIMGTRFDVEVARHFHPEVFRREWLEEGRALSRTLASDSADGLDRILAHVRSGAPPHEDPALARDLATSLRSTEVAVEARCRALAEELLAAIGQGRPLTQLGDRVATPLQSARGPVLEVA
jgi:hypothetical protein